VGPHRRHRPVDPVAHGVPHRDGDRDLRTLGALLQGGGPPVHPDPDEPGLTPTALIVGAGIGGLSAGIALRQAGWNVRIFERTASPRELGFGLLVAPNAIAALRDLGVADVVLARGFAPVRGELRRMDGTVLKRAEFPPPEALGGPTVVALRPALHGALLEAVGLDAIALSSEATGFTATGGRVTLQLANGRGVEGDLLVGADGVGSVIRRTLHPTEPVPRWSGIVAVRGAVHGAQRHLGDLSAVYYLGPGVESFLVRASDSGIYWALSLAHELLPPGMRDPAAILAHMSPRFEATFRAVTAATEELRCDELVDRDPIPFWGRGVATLLGDAAHPVLPHTGQGAAQAIVDAVTLGTLLRAGADIERALRAYEQERRTKTAVLLAQGRRTARFMRIRNPVACYLREAVVRLIPVKPMVKLVARINRRAGTDISR
jgi:2-polyprenyl-6-methoxyphenol hydroxylase-like FAD-dependent oxidoreductase